MGGWSFAIVVCSEMLVIFIYYGMNWLHIKINLNGMIDFSTTFNRTLLKAFTFQILFSCRPEIRRVETTETLNQDRFKSEVTESPQIIKYYLVPCRYKGDIICSYIYARKIL